MRRSKNPIRLYQLLKNMGFRYLIFRIGYALQEKSGILKLRFRRKFPMHRFISIPVWRAMKVRFFLDELYARAKPLLGLAKSRALECTVKAFHEGKLKYFNSIWYDKTDWHTDPSTGYAFDRNVHFSEIDDFSERSCDIKLIWEKSRFTFLYDLIRYDQHFQLDQSNVVFTAIANWIKENPVNCGPNWKCSQEISIRVLNWTFALQYYKTADCLTEPLFALILNSIYRQIQHVEENINFSRTAVRNNHVLTETLALYTVGLLYPFMPGSERRKMNGRKWFEEAIQYQFADDGTYIQSSMNYHRVAIQLLTWAIRLAELNGEQWAAPVYDSAKKSICFLVSCQDRRTGWLPNYGANDGSLFFPLTACHFRDFRPQLLALASLIGMQLHYGPGLWEEEMWWMGIGYRAGGKFKQPQPGVLTFDVGGYFVDRDEVTLTFIRCGHYRSRPSQADNLHLDIWVNGQNIFRDGGSYSYNTDKKWTDYFAGTSSHNTVMLGDQSQMRKGGRFIWYDWIIKSEFRVQETVQQTIFEGQFEGFRHIGKGIVHRRRVVREKGKLHWTIEDWIHNAPAQLDMVQIWHPIEDFFESYVVHAFKHNGQTLALAYQEGWYSESYGHKRPAPCFAFITGERYIKTIIQSKTHLSL
jgi:hypothetical protein